MKRFIYIALAFVALGASVASCDINKPDIFDDKNAFVAFDNATMAVDEDYSIVTDEEGNVIEGEVRTLKVPVTLASVAGIEENVSFKVVDGTAKEGTHFELLTTSGVLSFNKENRTQYIEFKIIKYPYYTGDLKFSIEFVNTNSVAQGAENTCTVTIGDLDHPLANFFGTYSVAGVSYIGVASPWTMTVYKDEEDDDKLWFLNLPGLQNGFEKVTDFYGVVSGDKTTITIPLGQSSSAYYQNEGDLLLLGCLAGAQGFSLIDTGNIVMKVVTDDSGKVTALDMSDFEYGLCLFIDGAGMFSATDPGLVITKD